MIGERSAALKILCSGIAWIVGVGTWTVGEDVSGLVFSECLICPEAFEEWLVATEGALVNKSSGLGC